MTQHPALENQPACDEGMEGLQTYQNPMPLSFPDQTGISMYGTATGNEHTTSMSLHTDDLLYPIPDPDGLNDFWQMPTMNSQFWFDGSDFAWSDNFFDSNSLLLDHVLSSSMQSLTATMQEYFDRKSRAPSPSLNKASKMWYSAPPNLDDHNKDIVRVFLNIFRRHIPETVSLFKDPALSRKNRAEYTLAAAATGGLFCTVPGSAEVAKSMYNDARRLLLASFSVRNTLDDLSTTPEDKLATVKTFILLELYGLCSGDKRSYEFVEAFHGNLIHAVQEYSQACEKSALEGGKDTDSTRLLEALYILDCYRVIIMQRPPSLSWQHVHAFRQTSSPTSQVARLYQQVLRLTDGGLTGAPAVGNDISLGSLASLTSHLWPAMYPRQNRYGADSVSVESLSLWKPDFPELACSTWLQSQGECVNFSCLAAYHMMNIMLHANLTVLQSFAHSPPGSAARDPKKSLAAREMHAWTQDRQYKIARWHAEQMIVSVEGAFTSTAKTDQQGSQQPPSRSSFTASEPRRLPHEAPHVPYAIYYATLVLWCGAVIEERGGAQPASVQAPIARGERILSLHKVHIAQLLARVLNEIK
ncbi:hypothetical protein LTR47_008395 [Exophiala xenobiotica]|nr:hypothetical protein LTR47_008395 [Exophiala xenobiotica]KAK5253453.1 hypothetical protein LTS06_002164 [Exophiala xenobiotica]KAK5346643.1 hypothetical protein LTR61_009591 [Exophiala xenobiotica]KAK5360413.1 hypothetical protein LTR11_010241 [Exophiala xenobiotica]KAK5363343.1 hypothetical protein LTS03_009689 [Exophiala xenobiotica]